MLWMSKYNALRVLCLVPPVNNLILPVAHRCQEQVSILHTCKEPVHYQSNTPIRVVNAQRSKH